MPTVIYTHVGIYITMEIFSEKISILNELKGVNLYCTVRLFKCRPIKNGGGGGGGGGGWGGEKVGYFIMSHEYQTSLTGYQESMAVKAITVNLKLSGSRFMYSRQTLAASSKKVAADDGP